MAATNVFQNVTHASYTSLLEVRLDDNTQFLQDGSDNDASFTFSQRQPKQCRITLRLRDAVQAQTIANLAENQTFVFTEQAAVGSAVTGTVTNVSWGQPTASGAWGQLREYQLSGIGGAFTIS